MYGKWDIEMNFVLQNFSFNINLLQYYNIRMNVFFKYLLINKIWRMKLEKYWRYILRGFWIDEAN